MDTAFGFNWMRIDTCLNIMPYDPGVSFHSAYYPAIDIISVVCSNKSDGAFGLMKAIEMKVGEA